MGTCVQILTVRFRQEAGATVEERRFSVPK
jgi:hypothetical protein